MRLLIPLIACAAATLPLSSAAAEEKVPKSVKVGALAPDFELTLVDDSKVKLADIRGNVIVLNFWATWCAPCKKELPLLNAFYRKLRDKGLRVYAVSTERSLPLFKLRPLFAKMAIPSVRSVKGPYSAINAVPTNIIIDRAGRVRYAKAAAFDLDDLNANIIPLLNEPAPIAN